MHQESKNIEIVKKDVNIDLQKYPKKKKKLGRVWNLNLAELGREGSVDLVKSATKSGEFFASLIGDEKLCHPFPVNVFRSFECHIRYFLSSSTHFSLPILLSLEQLRKFSGLVDTEM